MIDYVDYTDFPCVCGHMESSHLRVTGLCRSKKCGCKEFSNIQYLVWRHNVIVAETIALADAVDRLVGRMQAGLLKSGGAGAVGKIREDIDRARNILLGGSKRFNQ